MGKTETIKERRVDVYLDTLDRKQRWTEIAEQEGDSLSKFVQKCVEYTIEHGGLDYAALGEQSKQLHTLEQDIKALRKDVKQKDLVIEKLEADLQEYRMQPFLNEDFEGTRQYDRELITILKEGRRIATGELLRRLDIDPTQTERMQAMNHQLEQLEGYGLVNGTTHGWRWVE